MTVQKPENFGRKGRQKHDGRPIMIPIKTRINLSPVLETKKGASVIFSGAMICDIVCMA